MKLEVGKYYRTRDGRKVGPMERDGEAAYPFDALLGVSLLTWDENGIWSHDHPNHERDLIAEWVDEPVVEAVASAALVVSSNQLMIDRAPNGGWVVSECCDEGEIVIGAYTTAAEMIAALSTALGVTK